MHLIKILFIFGLTLNIYAQTTYPKLVVIGKDTLMAFTIPQNQCLITINEENKVYKSVTLDLDKEIKTYKSIDSTQRLEIIDLKLIYVKQKEAILLESETKDSYKKELGKEQSKTRKLEKQLNTQRIATRATAFFGIIGTALMTALYLMK